MVVSIAVIQGVKVTISPEKKPGASPHKTDRFPSKVMYNGACRTCLPYPLSASRECGFGPICIIKELMNHLVEADL